MPNDRVLTTAEFTALCTAWGLPPETTAETLRRTYLQRNYALIQANAPAEERERLRATQEVLLDYLTRQAVSPRRVPAEPPPSRPAYAPPVREPNPYDPFAFDRPLVNLVVPPAVALLAIAVTLSPLGFFLQGFHIWVHEFGHATIAWLTGKRALPLPIGWTSIAPEKSLSVYLGVLFLFALLFAAGWKERKPWVMGGAVALSILQLYMTWFLPSEQARMWITFGGVGGEFYLAAAMVGFFYFPLPEKFRWGACRYLFLFIGAGSFFATYALWKQIQRGAEGIPYGSMVNGEDDANGDMDTLHGDFEWTQHEIIARYNHLANGCLVALVVLYACFALRLNLLLGGILEKWRGASAGD